METSFVLGFLLCATTFSYSMKAQDAGGLQRIVLKRAPIQPLNCTITVTEIRRTPGKCTRLAAGPVACVSLDPPLMDPTNPQCSRGSAHGMALEDRSDNDISCIIEEKVQSEVSGVCKRFGRIPACESFDGGMMDLYNDEC